LLILILIFVAAFLLDEPLRRKVEADINNGLKGYTVRIGRLDFHPVGLSLDLQESTIYQSAHPDPPIAHIPNLSASVHWKALLRGRFVADFELDNPTIRFDLTQFSQEDRDETPIKEKGWQDAVQAIYPLKINRFVIRNGDVTYIDKGPFRPLQIKQLNLSLRISAMSSQRKAVTRRRSKWKSCFRNRQIEAERPCRFSCRAAYRLERRFSNRQARPGLFQAHH